MDFGLRSFGDSGGFSNNNGSSNAAERLLGSAADQNRPYRNMFDICASTPNTTDQLLQSNSSCRSGAGSINAADARDDDIFPALKLARTDSSSRWPQQELKMQGLSVAGAYGQLLIRHSSMHPDGRMPVAYSTTSSSRLSENDSPLSCDSRFVADPRLLRGVDPLESSHALTLLGPHTPTSLRTPYFQESYNFKQQRPASGTLGREGVPAAMFHASMHDNTVSVGGRSCLFTASQWAELEQQALIYKYLMHGCTVPPELLHSLRRSVAAMRGSPHNLLAAGWGGIPLGVGGNVDPEPGRCRRTDGKKWRCARPVVLEQKYCERHMHRGRHRRKAAAEAQNNVASTQSTAGISPSPSSSTVLTGPLAGPESNNSSPSLGAQSNHIPKSSMVFNPQEQPQQTKSLSTFPAATGNIYPSSNIGSLSASNQLSLPLHLQTGLSAQRDNRFLSHDAINKAHFDLRPEQLLSDISRSPRGVDASTAPNSALLPASDRHLAAQSYLQPQQQNFRSNAFGLRSYMAAGNFQQAHANDHHMKSCIAQTHEETPAMVETSGLNQLFRRNKQQQQQLNPVDNSSISMKQISGDSYKVDQDQPLRHFFGDWAKPRDSSTLSWSEADDNRSKPAANESSTQLSISIATASSSDIPASESSDKNAIFYPQQPPAISSSKGLADPPTEMGLGINLNFFHKTSGWLPAALEISTNAGGPLGEVLQSSSTPLHPLQSESLIADRKEGWDSQSHKVAPQRSTVPSPTGVLQKPLFGCFSSDSSSNASSPGSVRTDQHTISDNHKSPTLMNAPSLLAPT